jgi:molybdenum cofactor biosynthesis enzyme
MVKAAGHEMEIQEVRLLSKTGGVKGDWERTENEVHQEKEAV